MNEQRHYVGLDVSLKTTSISVVVQFRSAPACPGAVRVGLETGQLSNWLTLSLRRRGVPVVCMDARHARAALSLQINKTDVNDAFGLAQVVRTAGIARSRSKVWMLIPRSRLVSQRQARANTIRGLLKTFGLVSKGLFPVRVREQIAGNPIPIAIIELQLADWYAIRDQVTMLDRQMLARARNDDVARRLMTIPGVGVVIARASLQNRRSRALPTIRLGRCLSRPDPPTPPVR